ncbi:HD domain-containing protein [Clostridium guangxiense]|uniref:HD domain-containing protein n=1 Tax=Clostridium guangxiense TaxID=1662055 RepID=UPI001E3D6C94|nr:HD domain-containing protein [Clostridium guangxiense]MCD2346923.1 HD domain-containing protein [Clostridium guangxiense]
MKKEMYLKIEKYMLSCMKDGAHDCQHIYRVLYFALDIASDYSVDKDVLIAACLLHDIGREAQFKNSEYDHAVVGADMAYKYLCEIKWIESKASHVKACISTHRYRNNNLPKSIEAKILFDADKLDVVGTVGIARTLAYKGIVSEPLYSIDETGNVLDGSGDESPSFFKEYNWKLKNVYDKFFTNRAKKIAEKSRKASIDFYESMYREVSSVHKVGINLLKNSLEL